MVQCSLLVLIRQYPFPCTQQQTFLRPSIHFLVYCSLRHPFRLPFSATARMCAFPLNCHALSFTAMCGRSFLRWDTTGSFQQVSAGSPAIRNTASQCRWAGLHWAAYFLRLTKSRCGMPARRLLIGLSCCSPGCQCLSGIFRPAVRRGATPHCRMEDASLRP